MNQSEKTRNLVIKHYQKYPRLMIRDIFKYLYQSAFGCEHLVTDLQTAIDGIKKEQEFCSHRGVYIDALDGEFSRVHLSCLEGGLSAETLGKLFFTSAKPQPHGKADLEKKLLVARELVCEGVLPFSIADFDKERDEWREAGYPPVHHSEEYRKVYKPAYRVILNEYLPFLPVFARIDEILKERDTVIAIEGGSASGKTTLGEMLKRIYGCTVLHMDDFFLRPEQRTEARYREVGGNIDRERFLSEVLLPLKSGEAVKYRRFDCHTMSLTPAEEIIPSPLTVIEGAYSMHPALSGYYDLSVFLDISSDLQERRILKRNTPPVAKRFFEEWIPLERKYFSEMKVRERCDISIPILD